MNVHRLCILTSAVGLVILLSGFVVGSQFPFPSPDHDPGYIGDFYREHANGIRLMAAFVTTGGALTAPVAVVLGLHLMRIQGAKAMAFLELAMGSVSALAVCIPGFFWQTAAFRPERDPIVTQSWHDAGWLCFVATVFFAILQFSSTGVAVLSDRSERPVFPRWLGYLSFWSSAGLVPSALCLWFKTGPFAWNGVLTLYLAFFVAGLWLISVMVLTLRADRSAAESAVPTPAAW